jgi:HD-GYP domain-containing protein (c-di-GMP phosphodiesterase class II)
MKKLVPLQNGYNLQAKNEDASDEEQKQVQRYYSQKERFHQIERSTLIQGFEIIFSLYIHKGLDFHALLEASEKSPAKIFQEISNFRGDIVIKTADIPLYNKYLESLEKAAFHGKEKGKINALVIKEKSKIIMRDVLTDPRSGKNIKNSSTIVEQIATSIFDNKDTLYDLISIKNFDYYTYTHSVNVAVLSIGLGIASGISSDKIFSLGFGALLHDIGKSAISPEILNKPGKLSSMEFQIMKNHVIEGEKILKWHQSLPPDSFDAVAQHHEKLSGNGYPVGIKASAIKPYGRIAAIADCYDALTTQRPYKNAFSPFEALNIMLKETENYDQELLKTFIKMLGKVE